MQSIKVPVANYEADPRKVRPEQIKVVAIGPYGSDRSSRIRALTEEPISVKRPGNNVFLDFGRTMDAIDSEMLEEVRGIYTGLKARGRPVIVSASKQDPDGTIHPNLVRRLMDAGDDPVKGTSAHAGDGLSAPIEAILSSVKEEEGHDRR